MNRRTWIEKAAVTAALSYLPEMSAAAARLSRVIDTHTHFYDPTRPQGVPWPPKNSTLHRPVYPKDWLAVAAPHGVRETIVVEASQWVEDNQWVLDLAKTEKSIIGLVGNLDPRDAAFAENLKRFAGNPLFRGIRWRGDLVKVDAADDTVLKAAKLLADHDLELDVNGPPAVLSHAVALAKQIPALRIVINHLGGSGDPKDLRPEWKENVKTAAAQKNVFMKVSALVEQVKGAEGKAPTDTAYYLPVLDHLWECFGEDRVIYGSNWPVSDRGASYDVVFKIVSEYFGAKSAEAAEKYFWKNALIAYGIKG
jgi:L-fuconolactonase